MFSQSCSSVTMVTVCQINQLYDGDEVRHVSSQQASHHGSGGKGQSLGKRRGTALLIHTQLKNYGQCFLN